jgi:hypothetical protein
MATEPPWAQKSARRYGNTATEMAWRLLKSPTLPSPSIEQQDCRPARAEGEVNNTDARLWHPWLRINRVLRAMLHERWSAEAWPQVKVEFKKALALRSQIRRAGRFN